MKESVRGQAQSQTSRTELEAASLAALVVELPGYRAGQVTRYHRSETAWGGGPMGGHTVALTGSLWLPDPIDPFAGSGGLMVGLGGGA